MMAWLIIAALLIGLALIRGGRAVRRRRGLCQGRTLALDNRELYSARYGLAGRPDRILEGGIPEEWKSGQRVHNSHRAQMAVYLLLIEEEFGIRPPYGVIVTGDNRGHRIDNTPELREWVLGVADQVRAARRQQTEPIPVRQPAGKCRSCGMRGNRGQRSG